VFAKGGVFPHTYLELSLGPLLGFNAAHSRLEFAPACSSRPASAAFALADVRLLAFDFDRAPGVPHLRFSESGGLPTACQL